MNRSESHQYDPAGNLTQLLDRKNQQSTFSYDQLNRRVSASYQDNSSTSFVYDAVGRLTRATDSTSGPIDFFYDNLDRLVLEVTPLGAVAYEYDAIGRRMQMTVAGQAPVTYQYDAVSRLTQVAQGSLIVGIGYDAAGRRTSLTYPNGTSTAHTYDNSSRLLSVTHNGPSGVIEALTYTYDAAGNRTSLTRANSTASLLPDAVASTTYDAANQQTQFAGVTHTFDANGNLTNDGTNTYGWDARNRLVNISGGATASFAYDPLGRRANKTIGGTTTQFVYDGQDIMQELVSGTVTASYLRSLNIDEPFVRQSSTGNEHFHTDALGSSLVLSNGQGAPATTYAYEPFGKTVVSGSSANGFQFTGRENEGIGLYYYRARYYHPVNSRLLGPDPLSFAGGDVNLFAYAQNNPVNLSDPSGLFVFPGNVSEVCLPLLDKREKYFEKFKRELLCSLDFLPAVGTVNVTGHAVKHILEKHFPGATVEGGSIFGQGEKIADLVRKAESVAPVAQPNGNLERIVDAGRIVGTDVLTGQPTSVYTVITDALNNLKTMFPGKPRGR